MRERSMPRTKLLVTVLIAAALAVGSLIPGANAGPARGPGLRAHASSSHAPSVRRGGAELRAVPVATGLNGPSAFTFGPGGKIWYLERGTGEIRIYTPSTDNDRLFDRITQVDGGGERGALGIALHPSFPDSPFVYVYVTRVDQGTLVNEVLRIRSVGGQGAGTTALFRWQPVDSGCCHNGGRILFGPDGNLWVTSGENGDPAHSQQRANLRGKILRIEPGGGIPASNPFGTRIYAYGIRNSFGLAFDPFTDRAWESENGPECNDEINWIRNGGNFAWGPNEACNSLPTPRDTNRDGPLPRLLPKWNIRNTVGVTGLAFCDGCALGAGRQGDLFVGEVNTGAVRVYDLNGARTDFDHGGHLVLTLPSGVHSMEVAPNGRIYVSTSSGIYRIARA